MLLRQHKIHVELEPTLVLHRRSYRETSLILELLTQSHGRIALIAKGARKAKGKAGLLQPFQLLSCSFITKTDLGTLTQVELSKNYFVQETATFWQPKLNGSALYCGLYLNELILRCTTRFQELDGVMELYCKAIEKLSISENEALILREFEWKFLNLLGIGASLEVDANNNPIQAQKYYQYLPESGLIETAKTAPLSILGESLIELAANNWHNQLLQNDARKLTHQAMKPLVGDKPFSSRSLYLGLKKTKQQN
jgi:DNA repair protein RecO (recombination protein O)